MDRPTSYLAFKTVIGFKTNPTLVRAIAPAIRFPCNESLTSADLEFGSVFEDREGGGKF